MLIFLYGQDTYRSRQKLNEIVSHYEKVHKGGLSLKRFDSKEKSFSEFQDETQTLSMFGDKKLLILENALSNKNFKESFLEDPKDCITSKDIILFYEEKGVLVNDLLAKFLKKNGKCQEFQLLDDQRLKNWVKKEAESLSAELEPKALEKLILFVGNDLWQMAQEVKKLVNYKKNKKIEVNDVELLVRPKIETDIFETIDAIAQRNKKKALSLIHKHLEKGDPPIYLLSMIQFQFRNLLVVRELIEKNKSYGLILKVSKLHPFVVRKSYSLAQKFEFSNLKKIYQKVFQVDKAIKTGRINPEVALDMLISEV